MATNDYESWSTEDLIDESGILYELYLHGVDTLDDLHAVAEILRRRRDDEQKESPQPGASGLGGSN